MLLLARLAFIAKISLLCGFLSRHLELGDSWLRVSSHIADAPGRSPSARPYFRSVSEAACRFSFPNIDLMLDVLLAVRAIAHDGLWQFHGVWDEGGV